jgi:hypothetical protein
MIYIPPEGHFCSPSKIHSRSNEKEKIMNRKPALGTLFISLVLCLAILVGCAPKAAETPAEPVAAAPTDAPAPTEAPTAEVPAGCQPDWTPTYPAAEKYDPAIEISVPFSASYDFSSLPGDDILSNPMYNRVKDQLGIVYKIAWQADGKEYYTRLSNDLAGNTLPDAFRVKNTLIGQFVDPGAAEDITDIWNATASDLVKQKKAYPDGQIWREVTRDGHIYGIAYLEDGLTSDSLTLVRQDWLDKVNMKAPTTLDEMTAVAKASRKPAWPNTRLPSPRTSSLGNSALTLSSARMASSRRVAARVTGSSRRMAAWATAASSPVRRPRSSCSIPGTKMA